MNFVHIVIVLQVASLATSHQITVQNRCKEVIWVGTSGQDIAPLNGGFKLNPLESKSFTIGTWISGRIWGRTQCDSEGMNCGSGDCGATYCKGRTTFDATTLAEFGLHDDQDYWDISLVDGYNLPMAIEPVPGTAKPNVKCKRVQCKFDLSVCPNTWKQNGRQGLAGCKSLCSATREDKYCCPADKGYDRYHCPAQPSDGSRLFKRQCPDAYSYAYDDETSMFSCLSSIRGSSSYNVIFCP